MQCSDIGYRAQRHDIEQRKQIGFLAAGKEAALTQRAHQCDTQQEGDPDCGEVAMRGSVVLLVQPVGIDQRDRLGKFGRALVVIDDNHVDPRVMRHGKRFVCHSAAIDGDDQARTRLAEPDQGFARGTIAFEQAIRNVIACFDPEVAQQPDEQRGTGRAIDVVIAIDRDRFACEYRLRDAVSGHVHVAEERRVGQEVAQGGLPVAFDILCWNTARQQQLANDIVPQGLGSSEFHVPAAPAPCATGEGG